MKQHLIRAVSLSLLFLAAGCGANAVCGDGVLGGGETCDDGNDSPWDGCSSVCEIEVGYECPDGATCDPICGDGLTVESEVCDPTTPGYAQYCSADCTTQIASCGDGTLQPAHEMCDDGNGRTGDGCSACREELGFDCEGAGDTCDASSVDPTRTIGSLTSGELTTFCTWLIATLGGTHARHECGNLVYTVNTVSACAAALGSFSGPETACTIGDYEAYVGRSSSVCAYFSNPAPICQL